MSSVSLVRRILALAFLTLGLEVFPGPVQAAEPTWHPPGQGAPIRSVWTKRPRATLASTPAARPFLWRIEGAAAPRSSYLLGTAHLSHPDVLRVPRPVISALMWCDVFYNETPLRLPRPQARASAGRPRGPFVGLPLRQTLPPDLYTRADAVVRRLQPGSTLASLDKLPVWLVSLRINALVERADAGGRRNAPALDVALWMLARQAGKPTAGLESHAQHSSAFDWMTPEQQLDLLRSTVRRAETPAAVRGEALRRLREVYLSGDLERMREVAYGPFERNPNEFNRRLTESLFIRRNVVMADRIEHLMRTEPDRTHFFAVGAGHLPGDQGMLRLLAARGLTLTRVVE